MKTATLFYNHSQLKWKNYKAAIHGMILCTNGLKKETLKLRFHTRSQVNSNDHTMFFPGKPRLLRDVRKSEKNYFFKQVWSEQESETQIFPPQPLLLPPQNNNHVFLPQSPTPSSTEQEESSRYIYSTASVTLHKAGNHTTHLLLSKAPRRLWTSSWINLVVFLGLLNTLFLTQFSWKWFFEVRINSRFLYSTPGHLTSQGIIIKSSYLGVTSSHKLMTEQLQHLPSGAEKTISLLIPLFLFFF